MFSSLPTRPVLYARGVFPAAVYSLYSVVELDERISTSFCVPSTAGNLAVTDKTTGEPIVPLPVSGPDPGDRICYKIKMSDGGHSRPGGDRSLRHPAGPEVQGCPAVHPRGPGGAPTPTSSTTTSTTPSTTTTTLRFIDNGDGTITDNQTGLRLAGKRRALKEIPEQCYDEHESQLLGRLHHPSIPDITDRLEADGMVYLVLEFGGSPTLPAPGVTNGVRVEPEPWALRFPVAQGG